MKMGFFGIEVKPGKKVNPFKADNAQGRLRLTQATLGLGSSTDKSILQCFGVQKNPIFLCSLLPDKAESCSLDLEFEDDESVAFSVIGSRSIHLCGYFLPDEEDEGDAEDISDYEDPLAEDVTGIGSEESSLYDSEDGYEDELSDEDESDYDMLPASPGPKSGVVIEEIMDEEKPGNGDSQPGQLAENGEKEENQLIVGNNSKVPDVESEDEDGFPLSVSHGSKAAVNKSEEAVETNEVNANTTEEMNKKNGDQTADAKRKKRDVKTIEQDNQQDRKKKKKKQKKMDKEGKTDKDVSESKVVDLNMNNGDKSDEKSRNGDQVSPSAIDEPSDDNKNSVEKKKKKKKKKKSQENGEAANVDTVATKEEKKSIFELKELENEAKPSQVRTFPNGLVVEQLAIGKPDGKKAAPGKQVSVHYIGKLKKNGKIFDSNIGRAPFKFRLGIGQVIKGWDVGVNGMRIGDKRRLTIPPSMGYGEKGAGGKIPPNSWLVFDVELVDVR